MRNLFPALSCLLFFPTTTSAAKLVFLESNIFENPIIEDSDITLTLTGRTFHLGSRNRNENNNILGIGYNGYAIATMNNSFYDRSYIFSYHQKWYWQEWADIGLRIGGITGYKKEDNSLQLFGVTPLFAPTMSFRMQDFNIETALQTDVLVFTLNYQF